MPFHFNPSLWFVCKLCRETFPDTEKLKAHKLESHLGEILNIKCIVFEEKLLDHEWVPPCPEYLSKHDQLLKQSCASEINDEGDGTDINTLLTEFIEHNQKQMKLTNPYVSLKKLTVQELKCATSASAAKIGTAMTAGTRSKVGRHCDNFASTDKNGIISSEVSSFPLKLPIKTDGDNPDDDDVRKNKIRDLLNNAVIIKSEPNNDTDNRVIFEPQDMPISVVSTYSPSNAGSKIINQSNNNGSFNFLQQQPRQRQRKQVFQGNSEAVFQSSSTNLSLVNIPLASQIVPTFVKQPPQSNFCPVMFNVKGPPMQVQTESGSDAHTPTISNSDRLNSNLFPAAESTRVSKTTFLGKVEFINYDLIEQNRNVEMISVKPEESQQILLVHNDEQFPSKSLSNNSGPSDKVCKPFVCRICSVPFRKNYYLTQHERTHSNSRPFQCPHCDSKFKTKSNLRSHLISRHGLATPFRCQFCGKFSPSKSDLITHEASHTGARFYKCTFPNCEDDFISRSNLVSHTRRAHGKELGLEQFVCSTCGKSFVLRHYLNKHAKKYHSSVMQILS